MEIGLWGESPMIELSTKPLEEDDLHGASVLARSVLDAEITAEELKDILVGFRKAFDELWEIVKVQGDLLIELSEKGSERAWLARRIKQAERESARHRLPIWFWRKEDGMVKSALVTRAAWMHEEGYQEDDIFDLLKEYLQSIDEDRVSDKQLVGVIDFTRQSRRDSHADSC
jgi:hypothetical protein